jgi:hypothetical protein
MIAAKLPFLIGSRIIFLREADNNGNQTENPAWEKSAWVTEINLQTTF